jgi:hypothetical protein
MIINSLTFYNEENVECNVMQAVRLQQIVLKEKSMIHCVEFTRTTKKDRWLRVEIDCVIPSKKVWLAK